MLHMNKYPFYSDDPRLGLPTVTTVFGQTEYANNCKKYPEGYYIKGKDCILAGDGRTWVKAANKVSATPVYDYETKQQTNQIGKLVNGVVEVAANGARTLGMFTPNPLKNCMLYTNEGQYMCLDYRLVEGHANFQECYADGMYWEISRYSPSDVTKLKKKMLKINNSGNVYSVEDNPKAFEEAIKLYNSFDIEIDADIAKVEPYIKGLSFGVELEVINGTLPPHILAQNGVMICKDGSTKDSNGLYPPEFVTIPLRGAKGLQTLRNISKEIAKRSDIDIKCSYHLHIGGVKITRVLMVSLYRLCFKIQNDVFRMFPYYKTKPDGIKEKNYCKKLMSILTAFGETDFVDYINNSFTDIFTMLSGGISMAKDEDIKAKSNPWGDAKWQIKTRYFWVNFINPIFGKHDTIEFRLHSPTLNSDKIINWLLMCSAIIKFAETYPERCVKLNKISFEEVLNFYKDFYETDYTAALSSNLVKYYNDRVEYFAKDYGKGDYISSLELTKDTSYSFNALKID